MAHSGGSFIGIQAAARAPELYHAYIGMAQMTWQLGSERLVVRVHARAVQGDGDAKMARKLEAAPVTDVGPAAGLVRRAARQGHARPWHRHDARHASRSSRASSCRSGSPGVHDEGEGQPRGAASSPDGPPVGHRCSATDLTQQVPDSTFPSTSSTARTTTRSPTPMAKVLFRGAEGADEGLLHVRAALPTAPCSRSPRGCCRSCGRTYWPARTGWQTRVSHHRAGRAASGLQCRPWSAHR